MRMREAVVTVALAYYLNGKSEEALRRTANIMARQLSPKNQKHLRLMLSAQRPGAVLEMSLDKLAAYDADEASLYEAIAA